MGVANVINPMVFGGGNLGVFDKVYEVGGGNYNKVWTADKDYKYIIAVGVQDGGSQVGTSSTLNKECVELFNRGFGFNKFNSTGSGSNVTSFMLVKNVKKGSTFTTHSQGVNCLLGIYTPKNVGGVINRLLSFLHPRKWGVCHE